MNAFGQYSRVEALAPLDHMVDLLEPIFAAEEAQDALAAARAAREDRVVSRPQGILAAMSIAVEGLAELAFRRDIHDALFSDIVAATSAATGIGPEALRFDLSRRALMHLRWAALPPDWALRGQLRLVRAAAALDEISLWRQGEAGPEWIENLGGETPGPDVARAAHRYFMDGSIGNDLLYAVHVTRWRDLHTILVARAKDSERGDRRRAVLDAAAVAVRPALERDLVQRRTADRERALLEASERRRTRLGLDLHDGALQEVAVLAEDVRLFRRQVEPALGGAAEHGILMGRIDDIEARLVALDGELRDLARSSEVPSFLTRPLEHVLQDEAEAFRERSDASVSLTITGELEGMTPSQRIAVFRIVQESLANVREHSGADKVRIAVQRRDGGVRASVEDNGRGFDVERTLLGAAQEGRLGLVGMGERVGLLGGTFDIRSAPGGPTAVVVDLPEWAGPPVGERVRDRPGLARGDDDAPMGDPEWPVRAPADTTDDADPYQRRLGARGASQVFEPKAIRAVDANVQDVS
jgi:signal transduction histidine kinase